LTSERGVGRGRPVMCAWEGGVVTGLELLAGAAVGYLVRKARRVGGRADAVVDQALDGGMDALGGLVAEVLGEDPAVDKLREQARDGAETERSVRRATDAIAEAAESDDGFAERLQVLVAELRHADAQTGSGGPSATASGVRSVAVGGDVSGIISTGDGSTNIQNR
jgi:hypothetical protein